jgi:PBP1b-binding outer membrane lipoprotein LpoB
MKRKIALLLGLLFTLSACSAETQPQERQQPTEDSQSLETKTS